MLYYLLCTDYETVLSNDTIICMQFFLLVLSQSVVRLSSTAFEGLDTTLGMVSISLSEAKSI